MSFQKNLVKPITRRDFLRDSARAGTSMWVAGLAIKSSILQASLALPTEEGPLKAAPAGVSGMRKADGQDSTDRCSPLSNFAGG